MQDIHQLTGLSVKMGKQVPRYILLRLLFQTNCANRYLKHSFSMNCMNVWTNVLKLYTFIIESRWLLVNLCNLNNSTLLLNLHVYSDNLKHVWPKSRILLKYNRLVFNTNRYSSLSSNKPSNSLHDKTNCVILLTFENSFHSILHMFYFV